MEFLTDSNNSKKASHNAPKLALIIDLFRSFYRNCDYRNFVVFEENNGSKSFCKAKIKPKIRKFTTFALRRRSKGEKEIKLEMKMKANVS